jgi:hypothetical protein
VELAQMGNTVYFLGPFEEASIGGGKIEIDEIQQNLFQIRCSRWIPAFLRFKFPRIFHILMNWAIREIVGKLDRDIDIVWCFNAHHFEDLRQFGASLSIFHPVDLYKEGKMHLTRRADLVLGTTDDIISKFANSKAAVYKIGHGVASSFLQYCKGYLEQELKVYTGNSKPIQVGYVGNLLKRQTDRNSFRKIIKENPSVNFHIWGPLKTKESNIGARGETITPDIIAFIEYLESSPNVILYGAKTPDEIAEKFKELDAFFMCYNLHEAINKGADSHKILEYLSTGKVCISHHVSSYKSVPGLLEMLQGEDNRDMPALFSKVVSNLDTYNREELRNIRIKFAMSHAYSVQIEAIAEIINDHSLLR